MSRTKEDVGKLAAVLAEELGTGLKRGNAMEWVEQRLAEEMLNALRLERERCAGIADKRAEMWQASLRRYASGTWPVAATTEARERNKEALSIADAIRVDAPPVAEI
jgi:hypothetical protein